MKRVLLTNSDLFALVDDSDFHRVSEFKWFLDRTYARRTFDGYALHRFIAGNPRLGKETDHRNTYGLDCTRKNLREATHSQNQRNKTKYRNNTSGFKGVYFDKFRGAWKAYIRFRGVLHHIGYFKEPIEAAKAYDAVAKKLFGEFAKPNFPMRFPRAA